MATAVLAATALVPRSLYTRGGKRALDLTVSLIVLVVLAPLLLLSAGLVYLTDRGPILFVQRRVGRRGREFQLLKFRSMIVDPPIRLHEIRSDEPSLTLVGRWLRRTKVDELPQLINVLRGEMSLVGPRPMTPQGAAQLDDHAAHRHLVSPGLTGLAQVSGNTYLSWSDRWLHDVRYVQHCSLALDLQILLKTVLVVVLGEAHFVTAPPAEHGPRGPA